MLINKFISVRRKHFILSSIISKKIVFVDSIDLISICVRNIEHILNIIFNEKHLFDHSISVDWSSANWTQQGAAGGLEVGDEAQVAIFMELMFRPASQLDNLLAMSHFGVTERALTVLIAYF